MAQQKMAGQAVRQASLLCCVITSSDIIMLTYNRFWGFGMALQIGCTTSEERHTARTHIRLGRQRPGMQEAVTPRASALHRHAPGLAAAGEGARSLLPNLLQQA